MSPARRGTALAALAIGLFAVVVYVTTSNRRRAQPQPPPPPDSGRGVALMREAACQRLALRYERALDELHECAKDDDCLVEDRTGFTATLDGCYRITARAASRAAADAIADEWLKGGCAHELPNCEAMPRVSCRMGHCAELPPPPVPPSWHRTRVPGLLTMFVPPGMRRVEAMGEDSFVLSYEGKGASLSMEVGAYSPDPTPDAHAESRPWDNVLKSELVRVDGRPTTLFHYELLTSDGKPRAWAAYARVPRVGEPWFARWTGATEDDSRLFFGLDCETKAACDDAAIILGSIEVLSDPPMAR